MTWEKRRDRQELPELKWERQARLDPWLPFSDVLDTAAARGKISRKIGEDLYDSFAFTVTREQDRAIDGLVSASVRRTARVCDMRVGYSAEPSKPNGERSARTPP